MTTPDQRAALAQELERAVSAFYAAIDDNLDSAESDLMNFVLQHKSELVAALRSTAAAQTSDARDAARYRKLRDGGPDSGPCITEHRVNDWGNWYWAILTDDAAIDAALTPTDAETKG